MQIDEREAFNMGTPSVVSGKESEIIDTEFFKTRLQALAAIFMGGARQEENAREELLAATPLTAVLY